MEPPEITENRILPQPPGAVAFAPHPTIVVSGILNSPDGAVPNLYGLGRQPRRQDPRLKRPASYDSTLEAHSDKIPLVQKPLGAEVDRDPLHRNCTTKGRHPDETAPTAEVPNSQRATNGMVNRAYCIPWLLAWGRVS